MASVRDAVRLALRFQQEGRLESAAAIYREILERAPDHGDSLHFLGLIARERGNLAEALSLLERSVRLAPDRVDYLSNLGSLLRSAGRAAEAAEAGARAVAIRPDFAEGRYNLGRALRDLGRLDEAAAQFQAAVAFKPDYGVANYALGDCLVDLGRPAEAAASYRRVVGEPAAETAELAALVEAVEQNPKNADLHARLGAAFARRRRYAEALAAHHRAVELDPHLAAAHRRLGDLLTEMRRPAEAEAELRRAVELDPVDAMAHAGLVNVLIRLGRADEAVSAGERAVERRPDDAACWLGLGIALRQHGRAVEAIDACRRALALHPDNAVARHNLAIALADVGDLDPAIDALRRAIGLASDLAEAQFHLALSLLTKGELREGWSKYEWRWRAKLSEAAPRPFFQPTWSPFAVIPGTLLLWGEQGIGDEILFAGMVEDAAKLAGRVVLECAPRLVPLFARSFAGVEVVARQQPPHARTQRADIVQQSPLGSIARWLRPSFTAFPRRKGYLKADAAAISTLRDRYRALGAGRVVGLSWRSQRAKMGASKSVALEEWAPILAVEGVTFVDLQYGDTAAERAAIRERHGITVHHDAAIDALQDLDAFAAQVAAMDLVLSVSNTTAHLAGALGVQTWTLVPRGQGHLFCWFDGRDDSPWYPTMRLLRQVTPGDWSPVIERAARDLRDWARQSVSAAPAVAGAMLGKGMGAARSDARPQLESSRDCYRRGEALREAGRGDEALEAYSRAVALDPELAAGWFELGHLHRHGGRLAEAAEAFETVTRLRPDFVEALSNLSAVFREQGQLDHAQAALRRAVELAPNSAELRYNLGIVLRDLGRVEDAAAAQRQAIALKPDYARAHGALGALLMRTSRHEEAVTALRRAVEIDPDFADAHVNLAMALLERGRLAEGLEEYAWRPAMKQFERRWAKAGLPLWDGARLADGVLLVVAEQGIGDEILYAGLLVDAAARTPRIVFECSSRLVALFARSFPGLEVVPCIEPRHRRLSASDIRAICPLGHLPSLFRRDFSEFQRRGGYLVADAARASMLGSRYRALGSGPVIGLSWRSTNPQLGPAKSLALEAWHRVLAVPGVNFVDLQYGDTAGELAMIGKTMGIAIHHDPTIDPLADLDGFAAQVSAMDLVISVSNATLHVAGALGKPAWALMPEGPGLPWYWFRDRDDSPWYPSLRLYRQAAPGAWGPVIEHVAAELEEWLRAWAEPAIARR